MEIKARKIAQSQTQATAQAQAHQLGVSLDEDAIMFKGRKIGFVTEGTNGEWFACPLSVESHADPLQGRDNVVGWGELSPLAAAVAYAGALPR